MDKQGHLPRQWHIKNSRLPVTSSGRHVTLEKYLKGYKDHEIYHPTGNSLSTFPMLGVK